MSPTEETRTSTRPGIPLDSARGLTFLVYGAMLVAGVIAYFGIRALGADLVAPEPAAPAPARPAAGHLTPLAHILLALAAITLLARFVGGAFKTWLGQPPVIGEIVAGLLLGPSLLGAAAPGVAAFLLPEGSAATLGIIAKVGVVIFMFLVGLELDTKSLRGSTHATLAISHASIVLPFLLGAALALFLYPAYASANVSFTSFSLFLGVSLSVTAFPVLARILKDRHVQATPLGVTALACAAVDDVTAWTLLALVAGIASAEVAGALWTAIFSLTYLAAMLLLARPVLRIFAAREERKTGPLSRTAFAIVCVAFLFSAFATEAIGIHALFGAFLLGAILPHDGRLARELRAKLEDAVTVLLLPAFFAFTGMRTEIGLLSNAADWLVTLLVIAVATAGKFGGSLAAARLVGLSWRESSAIGILMNTRGLMELVALNLGLDLGVITPTVFTMLVIMALVTTFLTTPVLDAILGKRGFAATANAPGGV